MDGFPAGRLRGIFDWANYPNIGGSRTFPNAAAGLRQRGSFCRESQWQWPTTLSSSSRSPLFANRAAKKFFGRRQLRPIPRPAIRGIGPLALALPSPPLPHHLFRFAKKALLTRPMSQKCQQQKNVDSFGHRIFDMPASSRVGCE